MRTIKVLFIIICICFFNSVSSFAADNSLNFYTFQTLTDDIAGIPVVDLMVPNGFVASITSQWDRLDGNYPGHEVIKIENSDKSVGIYIYTNESYCEFQNKNSFGISIPQKQGPDYKRCITILNYMDSSAVLEKYMYNLGLNNWKENKSIPIDNNIQLVFKNEVIEEANTNFHKIQKINMMGGNGIQIFLKDVKFDKSKKQYIFDKSYAETSTSVKSVTMTMGNKMMETQATAWEIRYLILFKAKNKELFDKYYSTYKIVLANSRIRPEFYFLNLKIKELFEQNSLENLYHIPPISQIAQEELAKNYYADSIYTQAVALSERETKLWNDCIKDLKVYKSLDGRFINSSMNKEKIAQKGDTFFIGKKTDIPKGFTLLSKAK